MRFLLIWELEGSSQYMGGRFDMPLEIFLRQLDDIGYCFLPNLIDDEKCEFFRGQLEDIWNKYGNMYAGNDSSASALSNKIGEKVVYNLHNKGIEWFELFEHPRVLEILDNILKAGSYKNAEPYYLYNNSARCPLFGHQGQQLHLDSNLPGLNHPIVVNVLWLLDDFKIENGATRVVPGSHKWLEYAPDGESHPKELQVTGKRGGAIIFNANLWHGGGANNSHDSRWALALGYCRWFIKPSFDYIRNTPKHIYEKMTDKQKELLGFNLIPPKDEFTRIRRRSSNFEIPQHYELPK